MPVKVVCAECGKVVFIPPSHYARSKEHFCSRACHMKKMNRELNPSRMTAETREKLSLARFGKGEGRSYPKRHGRHEHRAVAEILLGRELRPGEVVHHINGNKRDNRVENLMVFSSQADHAKWHAGHGGGEANEIHTEGASAESP